MVIASGRKLKKTHCELFIVLVCETHYTVYLPRECPQKMTKTDVVGLYYLVAFYKTGHESFLPYISHTCNELDMIWWR